MSWKNYCDTGVIVLGAVACWAFFQFWYPYHFFYQEQNQLFLWSWDYISTYLTRFGGIALLIGDFLTQFYYYLYAGAAILSVIILAIGLLFYRICRNLRINRWIGVVAALAVMAFVAVCHFNTSYRLSSTISILGWCAAGMFLSMLWRGHSKSRPYWAIAAVLLIGMAGVPKIKPLKAPDFILEKNFAIDNEYHFGHHDKVIDMVRNSDGWNDQMLFFYNLVWAHRGELPDHLLDFTPNYLGTFEKIGPETPRLTIINMNELYWALGDMTFTERAAMMTNVFAPDNRNVRMMKRLAECNFVSGDSLATEKYLRILDKTFAYKKWAKYMREHGQEDRLYQMKKEMLNQHDTITISDNAHFLMMQLLDANGTNRIALDYLLCSDLLLKDITNFKRDYDRYCQDHGDDREAIIRRCQQKKLYQEALCIWLAGTEAPQEQWEHYIKRQDVMQQFIEYNNQRGNPRFKDTYWYYFDKIKAPEI